MKDLISVVVPIYNVEEYVSDCIESILKQTYANIEIILVNDGSTDNSGNIADHYQKNDNRIKVIHKINEGLSVARNIGIDVASGKYITFIDSDDWVERDYIKTLYELLIEASADISVCEYEKIYEGEKFTAVASNVENSIYEYKNYEALNLGSVTMIVAWAKLYKIELFQDIRYPKGMIHEDEFVTYKLIHSANKVVYTSEKLLNYRQRPNSIMAKGFNLKNTLGLIRALKEKIEFLENFRDNNFQEIISITYRRLFARYIDIYKRSYYFEWDKDKELFLKDFQNFKYKLRKSKQPLSFKIYYELYYKSPKYAELTQKNKREEYFELSSSYKSVIQKLKSTKNKKRMILMGTPEHGNLGDHLIAKAELEFLRDNFEGYEVIEITGKHYRFQREKIFKEIKDNDIILITGGGFLGSLWIIEEIMARDFVESFANNKIVILPSTIYFEDNEYGKKELEKSKNIFSTHKDLSICVRDKASIKVAEELLGNNKNSNVMFTPDIALYLKDITNNKDRKDVLLCIREDKESILTSKERELLKKLLLDKGLNLKFISTVIPKLVKNREREDELEKLFDEFRTSKIVVTDRLHGMVFAVITGTPCVAMDNLSGKVIGVYQWIKDVDYVTIATNIDEVISFVEVFENKGSLEYDNGALIEEFKKIKTVIEK